MCTVINSGRRAKMISAPAIVSESDIFSKPHRQFGEPWPPPIVNLERDGRLRPTGAVLHQAPGAAIGHNQIRKYLAADDADGRGSGQDEKFRWPGRAPTRRALVRREAPVGARPEPRPRLL